MVAFESPKPKAQTARIFTRHESLFRMYAWCVFMTLTFLYVWETSMVFVQSVLIFLAVPLWFDCFAVLISEVDESFFPVSALNGIQLINKLRRKEEKTSVLVTAPSVDRVSDLASGHLLIDEIEENSNYRDRKTAAFVAFSHPEMRQRDTQVYLEHKISAHCQCPSNSYPVHRPRKLEMAATEVREWLSVAIFGETMSTVHAVDTWLDHHQLSFLSSDHHLHRLIAAENFNTFRSLFGPQTTKATGADLINRLQQMSLNLGTEDATMLRTRTWIESILRVEETFGLSRTALRESEWRSRRQHVKARFKEFGIDRTLSKFSINLQPVENNCAADCEILLHALFQKIPRIQKFFRFGHQQLTSNEKFPRAHEQIALFYTLSDNLSQCSLQRIYPQGSSYQPIASSFDDVLGADSGFRELSVIPPPSSGGFFDVLVLWFDLIQRHSRECVHDVALSHELYAVGMPSVVQSC